MGNQPTPNSFVKEQWQLIEKNITHAVWRNRAQPNLHIQEHDKFSTDQYTYQNDKEIFQFRHNNPYLVAGVVLQEHQQHEFCSTNYKYRVFIQKIPIRLTDIEHIPFPDILHLYSQCLFGFQLLAQKLGYYFEVQESYIGINERGVVKVWLSKYFANSTSIGGKISQQQMVESIIDIVDKNSDPYQIGQSIPTIRNYLYRNADALKFAEAKRQLHSYAATYHQGIIPKRLDCVQQAGGVYAIANRPQIYQTPQTFGQHQLIPNSRIQNYDDPNRPQLVSYTNISQQDYPSQQNIDYMPLAPLASIPNQLDLKGSEAIPQVYRQKAIVNPVQVRQNMQVVRRRKSDYQKQYLQYSAQLSQNQNGMKYRQALQQQIPLQSRQLALSRNIPSNLPSQNHVQFNFVPPNQGFSPSTGSKINAPVPIRPPNTNFGEASQQITFKQINQNTHIPPLQISDNPSLNISGNPSLNHFSPGPSLINSHRNNSSNVYLPDQTKIISQKVVSPPLASQDVSAYNSRAEVLNSFQNNSFGIIQSKGLNEKINPVSASSSKQVLSQERKKEVIFTPSVYEQKAQLLASFNPAFKNQKYTPQPQKSIEKQIITNKTLQIDSTLKRSSQIHPDDGKSSQQFLQKLREINSSFVNIQNHKSKSTLPFQNTPITYNNGYSNNVFYQQGNERIYEQIGTKTPVQSIMQVEEQFGRNAVSNIIENNENSYKNINPFVNNQPLKFQQGLTMKYSRLEADQPEQVQFRKPSFGGKYEPKIDSDLLADLNRFKK